MTKLLFETSLKGHRIEYVHHIYLGMLEHPDDEFVIVVPEVFKEKRELYHWPDASHIRFVYMSEALKGCKESGTLRQSFRRALMLRKYVIEEKVDSVFLNDLMAYIPAISLLIPHRVKVSGILYNIYLYLWKNSSLKTRILDIIKYLIMRFSPCIKAVFVLNDASSAAKLNKLYHTDKFKFITDPYNAIDYSPRDVRKELGVSVDDKIFLHFGGLSVRKGTLDILRALALLPAYERKKCFFVFAGKIYEPIKAEFYGLLNNLSKDIRVRFYDQFCSNELLADLCVSSDFILMPYRNTAQSSGLLGHAAYYGTPVIGPKDGLIGKLIRKNHLGIQIDSISPASIADAICKSVPFRLDTKYLDQVSIDQFKQEIFKLF